MDDEENGSFHEESTVHERTHSNEDGIPLSEASNVKDSNNIFITAKNAVVGLVNDMAKKLSGESSVNTTKDTDHSERDLPDIIVLLPNEDVSQYDDSFLLPLIQKTILFKANMSINLACGVWLDYALRKTNVSYH